MATAKTQIDRVVKGFRERGNPDILAANMTSGAGTLSYTGVLAGWGPGTRIEIGTEIMLVTDVDYINKVATVTRGWLETTAVAHNAGEAIFITPRILRSDILDLFNECLDDLLGRGLYVVDATELTYSSGLIGYDLPAEALGILRVDALKDANAKYWEPIYDWLEMDNASTADFTSGRALMMRVALPFGARFRVVYKKAFTELTAETDDLGSVAGLRPYMEDLLFYYATSRVMVDLERHRSQIEAAENHQRAQDSPAFLALRTGEWYQARYRERVKTALAHQSIETKNVRGTGYGS